MQTAATFNAGDRIGEKYEIVALLSRGGMGAVYVARQTELQRQVAIKVLAVNKPLPETAHQRFEREAKAAGSLNHPNIVSIYDYGLLPSGQPYLVMEMLSGQSLDRYLDEKAPIGAALALRIFVQVAAGLAHAHAAGLVHRDLKPSNIMLMTNDQGSPFIKLIDFGIAKSVHSVGEPQPITKPGQIFGSPLYMSPEQCLGRKLDARCDIYSLGCVMYEALCGRPPFIGETLLNTIYLHVNETVRPFNERLKGSAILPDSRLRGLEKIVLKCLAKRPEERFQTANELLRALTNCFANEGVGDVAAQILIAPPKFIVGERLRWIISILLAFIVFIGLQLFAGKDWERANLGRLSGQDGHSRRAVDAHDSKSQE